MNRKTQSAAGVETQNRTVSDENGTNTVVNANATDDNGTWPPQLTAASSSSTLNENSSLNNTGNDQFDTYLSEARIIIPESEEVIFILIFSLLDLYRK